MKHLCELWRNDPLKMQAMVWPEVKFYNKQREIIESVRDNKNTVVVAGNMLGKDYVAGFICVWYFLVNDFVRVVTTSVKDDHLDILWGEIGKFIRTAKIPLDAKDGGPFKINHREITKTVGSAEGVEQSYLKGQVSKKGEGMSGHHAEHTLIVIDEASGVDQHVYDHAMEWAKKGLIFGNPNPCNNFFFKADEEGDIKLDFQDYYRQRLIRVTAMDSPSVRLGIAEERLGQKPSLAKVVPGVITYDEYKARRATWDPIMQCIKLDAQFYRGAEINMFPPEWLNESANLARTLPSFRPGKAMGIDTAEGGDSTVWAIVDDLGLIKLVSLKTSNTAVIKGRTIALIKEYDLDPEMVIFDQGGGGQEHADYLRQDGYNVRTVSFGESTNPDPTNYLREWEQVQIEKRERYTFKNRRAQMYWMLRQRIKPKAVDEMEKPEVLFAIPSEYEELRRQLGPIPLTYDEEGRVYLLPKRRRPNAADTSTVQSLEELIGCSPDEADALVMAIYAMDSELEPVTIRPLV